MATHLTDSVVKALPAPSKSTITYDDTVRGFGVRVTPAGAKSFVLNYRTRAGRERRYTIGSYPDWKVGPARGEAKELKKRIDIGEDPLAESEAERSAKTVSDLCDRLIEDHLPKIRPRSAREYQALIENEIRPALRNLKVSEVSFSDVDALHRKITKRGAAIAANRAHQVLRKAFSLAIKLGWRSDNPCRGIERNPETKRDRYLSGSELVALTRALNEHEDKQAADIVRLLLLTGARRGEVQGAKWADLDLKAGVWVKPASTTKQAKLHRVPLSAPAVQLLSGLLAEAQAAAKKAKREISDFVFPSHGDSGHRVEIKQNWRELCIAAGIVVTQEVKDGTGTIRIAVTPSARIHDLRHTYASVLASAGLSLPIIGALLGHSNPTTTHRYAHLLDDPLRAATERAAAIISGGPSAEILPFHGKGSN